MTDAATSLDQALRALAPPGIALAWSALDGEGPVLPAERDWLATHTPARRRASAAGRRAARGLLASMGREDWPLLPGPSGAPIWPADLTGSLAHDEAVAIAALAARSVISGLGVDVEPAQPLPPDTAALVLGPGDRIVPGDPLRGRVVFALKEAVYKALHPLDGRFLEFEQVEVDLARGRARVADGPELQIRVVTEPQIIALAWLP